ncbi:MAG: hypothetical protein LBT15_02535, partial [Synergistaceae bacterium]|nr:hypothetical protein [Synergistaceae bacterium]
MSGRENFCDVGKKNKWNLADDYEKLLNEGEKFRVDFKLLRGDKNKGAELRKFLAGDEYNEIHGKFCAINKLLKEEKIEEYIKSVITTWDGSCYDDFIADLWKNGASKAECLKKFGDDFYNPLSDGDKDLKFETMRALGQFQAQFF